MLLEKNKTGIAGYSNSQLEETRLPFPSLAFVQVIREILVGESPPVFPFYCVKNGIIIFVLIRHYPTFFGRVTGLTVRFVSVLVDKDGGSFHAHFQFFR